MKARRAGQSAYLLLDVSAVLAENDVEYAVIGAMAAAVLHVILLVVIPPNTRSVKVTFTSRHRNPASLPSRPGR